VAHSAVYQTVLESGRTSATLQGAGEAGSGVVFRRRPLAARDMSAETRSARGLTRGRRFRYLHGWISQEALLPRELRAAPT